MKRTALLLLISLQIFGLSACTMLKTQGDLNGQVAFKEKGSQTNVFGAGITVRAIAEKDLTAYLKLKQASVAIEVDKLRKAYAEANRNFEIAQQESLRLQSEQERCASVIRDIQMNNESATDDFERWTLKQKEVEGQRAHNSEVCNELSQKASAAKAQMENWPTLDYYFKDLPKEFASTTTREDGWFSLKLPSTGRFALAVYEEFPDSALGVSLPGSYSYTEAGARRQPVFCWLVWVLPDSTFSKKIILNETNTVTSVSADSAIHVKGS